MRHELAPRNIYNLLLGASLTWGYLFDLTRVILQLVKLKFIHCSLFYYSMPYCSRPTMGCWKLLSLTKKGFQKQFWWKVGSAKNLSCSRSRSNSFMNFLIAFINFGQVFFHLILVAFITVKVILHTRLIKQAARMKNQKVTSNVIWICIL